MPSCLKEASTRQQKVYLYTVASPQYRANAAVLVGAFQIIYQNRTASEAAAILAPLRPYPPFRDASCVASLFPLKVEHVLAGVEKAKQVGFIDWHLPNSRYDVEEVLRVERVEHGDMNWILPGKFLAFSGPQATRVDYGHFQSYVPEDYWQYFRSKGVTGVIRLNKRLYDPARFTKGGLHHYELYFPDGSCPNDDITARFMRIAENEPGALAIHCKAGLGRTGTLICLYLMKHYRFTAEEVLGYIRLCRPGSVIGPQQLFLLQQQQRMWDEGDRERALVAGMQTVGLQQVPVVAALPAAPANSPPAPVPVTTSTQLAPSGDISRSSFAATTGRQAPLMGSAYARLQRATSIGGLLASSPISAPYSKSSTTRRPST